MLVNIFTLFAVLTVAFNFSALIAYKVLLGEVSVIVKDNLGIWWY